MIKYLDKKRARLIVSQGTGNNRKRVTKTIFYNGKKDAERQYNEFRNQVLSRGLPEAITVEELLNWYIDTVEILGARPTTIYGYKSTARRIISAFGAMKARDLTTYRIEKSLCLNRKFSPKTIKNTVSLLNAAYKKALASNMLQANPCEQVQIPKQEKKEVSILSPEEIGSFLTALQKEPKDFQVACKLALFCGLRRSEVLGLTEQSIVGENLLSINQGRHRIGTEDEITDPKTSKSRRVVAVPGALMQEIEELIAQHRAQPFPCCDYLLQDCFGDPMKPHYLTEHIIIFENNNSLPHVNFHALRHTHASILNSKGVDIARISAQLGHSNINTTLGVYTHVFGTSAQSTKEIAEEMDDYFGKIGKKGHI